MTSRMRLLIVGLATAVVLSACGGSSTATDNKLELTSPAGISEIITEAPADLVVLDIRTPEEFAEGHLAGAINIDYYADDFEAQLAELDLSVPYVMYCRSGNRSSKALPLMDSIGFEEVYELDGGISAWQASGNSIER